MKNSLNITLQGQMKGKASSRKNKYGTWYNPSEKFMNIIEKGIKEQLPKSFNVIPKGVPVIVNVNCFFEPNKSEKTKKFLDLIKNEEYPYLKKPDKDNIMKLVGDCLSQIVVYDDNQIYGGYEYKYYTPDNARTEIEVKW